MGRKAPLLMVHACFLDKQCRKFDCPPRIALGLGRAGTVNKYYWFINVLKWSDRGFIKH